MTPLARAALAAPVSLALVAALSACVPEPEGDTPSQTASAAASSTPTAFASASAPTTSASPTIAPTAGTALPSSCESVVSAAQRTALADSDLPLNDPGVTLLSTEQAALLDLLQVVPTVRCSWGAPGDRGIATNVSIVDPGQAATVRSTLEAGGFSCEDSGEATVCRIEQRGVSLDDKPFERGEVQALSGDVWVSTSYVNVDVTSYTDDILSTVRG